MPICKKCQKRNTDYTMSKCIRCLNVVYGGVICQLCSNKYKICEFCGKSLTVSNEMIKKRKSKFHLF